MNTTHSYRIHGSDRLPKGLFSLTIKQTLRDHLDYHVALGYVIRSSHRPIFAILVVSSILFTISLLAFPDQILYSIFENCPTEYTTSALPQVNHHL